MEFEGLIKLAATASKDPNFLDDLKTGTLHERLGIPQGQKIPTALLQQLKNQPVGSHASVGGKKVAITPKLEKKVNFALNAKKWH